MTHTAVTPLDVVKCNMQIDPKNFPGIGAGFSRIASTQGLAGLFKGWFPTLIGYSAQGAGKFGLYEYFKKTYADAAGPELTARYQSLIFLAGSASAEFFADIALCPFEAVKVKVQTVPGFAKGFTDGFVDWLNKRTAQPRDTNLTSLICSFVLNLLGSPSSLPRRVSAVSSRV